MTRSSQNSVKSKTTHYAHKLNLPDTVAASIGRALCLWGVKIKLMTTREANCSYKNKH